MCRLLLLLAVLALSGCAHKPFTQPGKFSDENRCLIIQGESICIDGTPQEVRQEHWDHWMVAPALDAKEREALRWCGIGSAADIASTYVAMTACGAVELNPLFAGMSPAVFVIVNGAASYAICKHYERLAKESPLARSTSRQVVAFATVRGAAAAWNTGQMIARCL